MKGYSVITREFPKESNQTEESRENNDSQNIKPFERTKTLTIGIVMYYVKSHLITMGTIRGDWVKLRISKLQFLIILTRGGLYRMVNLKSLVGQSCSALYYIHGGFVKLGWSGL